MAGWRTPATSESSRRPVPFGSAWLRLGRTGLGSVGPNHLNVVRFETGPDIWLPPVFQHRSRSLDPLFSSAQHHRARGEGQRRPAMAGTGCHSVLSPSSHLSPAFLSRHRAVTLRRGACGPSKGEFYFSARDYLFFFFCGKETTYSLTWAEKIAGLCIATVLYFAVDTQN
jgi:hypothetical protein